MDQLTRDLTRFKQPAMAAVGGIAAALVVATLPAVYLEKIIGITGLSEIISAAAPPLGNTAKSLIALVAGVVSASIIYLFINRKGGSDMSFAIRRNLTSDDVSMEETDKPKFGLPKFSFKKLLQKPTKESKAKNSKDGEVRVMDLADLPKLRGTDSHPDAPARRPIFADQDLGTPLADGIKPFEEQASEQQDVAAPPVSPAAFTADKVPQDESALDLSSNIFSQPAGEPVTEPVAQMTAETAQPAPQVVASPIEETPKEDMSGLSIMQLAERLESGLARLQELEIVNRTATPVQIAAPAGAPVQTERPAGGINVTGGEVPLSDSSLTPVGQSEEQVQATRQADMDAALKAALGTLEKMTANR